MPGDQCRKGRSRVVSHRWGLIRGHLLGVGRKGASGPKGLGGWGGIHVDRALSMGAPPLTFAPSGLSRSLLFLKGPGLGQGRGLTLPVTACSLT